MFSVQFSSVMSDSLQPHGLQHARLPCSSLNSIYCSRPNSGLPSWGSCPGHWTSMFSFLCSQEEPGKCLQILIIAPLNINSIFFWQYHSLIQNYVCMYVWYHIMCAQSPSHVCLFVTPWVVACQSLLSTEFSSQEYCSGLPFSSPEDLPNPGIVAGSPALIGGFFPTEPPGKLSGAT